MNSMEPQNEYCKLLVGHSQFPFSALRSQGRDALFSEISAQIEIWLPRYRGEDRKLCANKEQPTEPELADLDLVHSTQGIVATVISQAFPMSGVTVQECVRFGFAEGERWLKRNSWHDLPHVAIARMREEMDRPR